MKNILVHFSFLPTRTFIKNSKSQGLAELALYMKIEYYTYPPPLGVVFHSHSAAPLIDSLVNKTQREIARDRERETIYALADVRLNKLASAYNGKLMNYDRPASPSDNIEYAKAPGR